MKITVKAARVNTGMKVKKVAAALNLSVGGYSKKENGHARFYIDEIAKLSQLFRVPFENFFESGCLNKTQRRVDDIPIAEEQEDVDEPANTVE